jgi:transcriptional regulator with XRE-family HTH domain
VTVTDLLPPIGTETPIERTSAANPIVDALEYAKPTVTATVQRSSLERLVIPQSRRKTTEWAVVLSHQPIAPATVPMPALGELSNIVYPYWLTIALTEPFATSTPASFEAWSLCKPQSLSPFVEAVSRWTPQSVSPFIELVRHYANRPEPQETRAYRTFAELADSLGMTQEETARLLGMGRTTPLAWRRSGHEPQPARARRLYQTHALVSTLERRLGREEMRRWMGAGDPSPLALIADGDVTGADDLAEGLIFGTAPSRERLGTWVEEPTDAKHSQVQPTQGKPRRVRRRPPRRRTR